ncbi:delta-1-pyrroline-5-carboxylate dehydrogenase [Mesotoga prima MesG1.Ag.4.2]|jgi:1-pyrroline-5-carboxylate dehydrogenase|uniref:L-glutamate gamma-semialdehyde dehydrogenase n=1 Tax=Mesotoga prima MesG1.Ag.4.2 TaxID=660470 RepID=I2F787_9BACT|nr:MULTISPECIES: L-glutamate gamma-semialdehyde dehydrogenase [Mesotoga]AFK07790.1 delta-1-pyrroline-5-carboxylate dehydrogenase [Mesotoga prima MesG1.Ag.4.2]MDK2944729.1 1-pyrroline-5-carboxylate dehydrogenase [Mesotoga sp.]PIJ60565.1 1-pyrroline-5-carboxylate dehydrogenase [Mesotoga sp. H07.pep.5.3]
MFDVTDFQIIPPFKNEPYIDPSDPEVRSQMMLAFERIRSHERNYDLFIGGRYLSTESKIVSKNPADPDEVVGTVSKATREIVDKAIDAAYFAFKSWSRMPASERVVPFLKAAQIMRDRRYELDATMILEVGKSWIEADADLAEAIDFLEYYSREALRYGQSQPVVQIPGEYNELRYIPLGVGVVIPPWNFPSAIMAGMTTAAAVSGNCVLLKPASDAPVIAAKFVDILREAGLPDGVVNYVPGSGSEIGDYLVEHPLTRFVSFTGSKEVGLRINELAAKHQKGQKWIKRVILEMGGKDCVVVDETADTDAASTGAVASAFGFQGQKCSAGSRIIVVREVYDEMVKLVKQKTEALTIGDTTDPNIYMGPVINESAVSKILRYIELGKKESKLITGGNRLKRRGYFIEPTVFADASPTAAIAQEEIFGPVTAIIEARDFDHAIAIANGTEYGLTGAFYSKRRDRIEKAKTEIHVGNLYFNRKCTGALVGVQPFGGFNLSGTDSKAGGRDYLLLFLQGKSISEKIL